MNISSLYSTADVSATDSSNSDTSSSSSSSTAGVSEDEFLQLLVAQIKNQDPTNPTDSVQYVTQLAQFSSLEQLIDIRKVLDNASSGVTSSV